MLSMYFEYEYIKVYLINGIYYKKLPVPHFRGHYTCKTYLYRCFDMFFQVIMFLQQYEVVLPTAPVAQSHNILLCTGNK